MKNKYQITIVLMFVFVSLNAQNAMEELYISEKQKYESIYSVNNNFFLEFSISCHGCIEGSNKESYFFICDTNNECFFQKIGLYSISKKIPWNIREILFFFETHDSILQIDCKNLVLQTPFFHQGITYQIKIHFSDSTVFFQTIPQMALGILPDDTPIRQYVNLLKQIIFDISVHSPNEYFPKTTNKKPKHILKKRS
jgi:hypothetical protein